jgi:hypothetical protein
MILSDMGMISYYHNMMSDPFKVEGLAKEPAMDETELQVGSLPSCTQPRHPAASQAVFHRGLEQRAVAAHAMNAESSRSHVLFTVGGPEFMEFMEFMGL